MDQAIILKPLTCLKCSTPIPAEPDEVAWTCATCGQGMYLDVTTDLIPLVINYSVSLSPNAVGKPFWVADGQVALSRETFGSSKSDEAQRFWSQSHRFIIPAFRAPLETLLSISTNLLLNPPNLKPGPVALFEPVIMPMEDAKPAAEFIIVAIEAGRPDHLKQVSFDLQLSQPTLWILP